MTTKFWPLLWCFVRFQHLRVFLAWPSKSRWETSAKSTQRNNHNNLHLTTTKQHRSNITTKTPDIILTFMHECRLVRICIYALTTLYGGYVAVVANRYTERLIYAHMQWLAHFTCACLWLLNYNAINYYVTYENPKRYDWYGIFVFSGIIWWFVCDSWMALCRFVVILTLYLSLS